MATADTSFQLPNNGKDTGCCLPRRIAEAVAQEQGHRTGSVELLVAGMLKQTTVPVTDSTQSSTESAPCDDSVHWTAWKAVCRCFVVVPQVAPHKERPEGYVESTVLPHSLGIDYPRRLTLCAD